MNTIEFVKYQRTLDIRAQRHLNDVASAARLKDGTLLEIRVPDGPPVHTFLTREQTFRLGIKLLRIWLGRMRREDWRRVE